jgi:Lon protease-like protein
MFPLSAVLFPEAALPLHVFEPRYQSLVADCLAGDGEFGVVLIERGSEVGGGERRLGLGTVARIEVASPLPDGRFVLLTRGTSRIRVVEWLADDPYPAAMVEDIQSVPLGDDVSLVTRAVTAVRQARALMSELGDQRPIDPDLELGDDPEVASWQLCAMSPVTPLDAQLLLSTDDVGERLGRVIELAEGVTDDLIRLLAEPGPAE